MTNLKNHDIQRFEAIVDQTQDWLFRFAYMRVGVREDSEDLVQDTLLSLYNKLITGSEIEDIRRYLLHSVSNACIDYHRRRRPERRSIEEINDLPADEIDREIHDEYIRIRRLLDGLPDEQSEVVRLKCYDSLTFREISELLDIPEATAKSRYRYAIAGLQKKLNYGK